MRERDDKFERVYIYDTIYLSVFKSVFINFLSAPFDPPYRSHYSNPLNPPYQSDNPVPLLY